MEEERWIKRKLGNKVRRKTGGGGGRCVEREVREERRAQERFSGRGRKRMQRRR